MIVNQNKEPVSRVDCSSDLVALFLVSRSLRLCGFRDVDAANRGVGLPPARVLSAGMKLQL